MARPLGIEVSNKQAYRVMKKAGLLQTRRVRKAEPKWQSSAKTARKNAKMTEDMHFPLSPADSALGARV